MDALTPERIFYKLRAKQTIVVFYGFDMVDKLQIDEIINIYIMGENHNDATAHTHRDNR